MRNRYERPGAARSRSLGRADRRARAACRALPGRERRHRDHRRHADRRRQLPRRRDPAGRRADALRAARAHRPPAACRKAAYSDTPRNTLDAIETGCRHAQAGAVERMYRVFRDVELDPLCIVSGGAGRTLVDQLSMPRRYVENLVLDGLARIALGLRGARRDSPRENRVSRPGARRTSRFFAWSRYCLHGRNRGRRRTPARQIEPEKLKIVAPQLPPPRRPPAPAPGRCAAGGRLPRMGQLHAWPIARAPRRRSSRSALGPRLAQRRTEETPRAGGCSFRRRAAARARCGKAAELKALGVNDYFIMRRREPTSHGRCRSASSAASEAAQARLAALRAQGVRSALVGQRETVVPKMWLQVKGVDPALEARLKRHRAPDRRQRAASPAPSLADGVAAAGHVLRHHREQAVGADRLGE